MSRDLYCGHIPPSVRTDLQRYRELQTKLEDLTATLEVGRKRSRKTVGKLERKLRAVKREMEELKSKLPGLVRD